MKRHFNPQLSLFNLQVCHVELLQVTCASFLAEVSCASDLRKKLSMCHLIHINKRRHLLTWSHQTAGIETITSNYPAQQSLIADLSRLHRPLADRVNGSQSERITCRRWQFVQFVLPLRTIVYLRETSITASLHSPTNNDTLATAGLHTSQSFSHEQLHRTCDL